MVRGAIMRLKKLLSLKWLRSSAAPEPGRGIAGILMEPPVRTVMCLRNDFEYRGLRPRDSKNSSYGPSVFLSEETRAAWRCVHGLVSYQDDRDFLGYILLPCSHLIT